MPGKLQTLINPNMLALQQAMERVKALRDRADTFDELSTSAAPVQSWTQALARVLQGYVAGRERKQADTTETDAQTKVSSAMAAAHQQFQADVASGMTPQQLHAKYSGNPTFADDLKPYDEIWLAGAKKGAEVDNTLEKAPDGSYKPVRSMDKPQFDPNAKIVTYDGGKTYVLNPALLTFDRAAQATGPGFAPVSSIPGGNEPAAIPSTSFTAPVQSGGNQPPAAPQPAAGPTAFTPSNISQVESGGHDFLPNGQPVVSKKGAMYGMQVLPSTAANPGYGVQGVDPAIMALSATDPRRAAAFDKVGVAYANAMRQRFGNLGPSAYNAGPGRVQSHLASGTPLPAETQAYQQHFSGGQKQPDGVVNGKPYWLVNGVPYDNPNGN